MKDPAYELSSIIVTILQVASAMFGGLFLWLSIMAFNGQEMMNSFLKMADDPHYVSAEEAFVAGLVLLGMFIICIASFFILRYLKRVVKKEANQLGLQ
ncbi:hypothetical protein IFO69_19930 [Echinicola sp. CAU 1574]|uniref:Uncharacterized protein n=1 Tax=Echinicola arenosa TaxID=2774144 RepID=A0ABR9AQG4_9BACT|nr:hypothetical protein [Echinicola arenosa]MBD8491033.1 hypothetical protein [Echinicola arenosa]